MADTQISFYQCPSEGQFSDYPNRRDYFAVTGGKTLAAHGFRGDVFQDGMFAMNRWLRIADLRDGTSNTLAIGESVHVAKWGMGPGYGIADQGGPVAWLHGGGCSLSTKCDPSSQSLGRAFRSTKHAINSSLLPMADDEENDAPFGSFHTGGAMFVYGDGHVGFVSDSIDINLYQAISTTSGAEVVGDGSL